MGSEGSRCEPERPEAERSEAAGPEPTQPNWIQTNLGTKRRDQTGGLIESMTSLKLPRPPPFLATALSLASQESLYQLPGLLFFPRLRKILNPFNLNIPDQCLVPFPFSIRPLSVPSLLLFFINLAFSQFSGQNH